MPQELFIKLFWLAVTAVIYWILSVSPKERAHLNRQRRKK